MDVFYRQVFVSSAVINTSVHNEYTHKHNLVLTVNDELIHEHTLHEQITSFAYSHTLLGKPHKNILWPIFGIVCLCEV